MAKLYGEIAAKALLTLDKSFARANGQPLDASEVYYSLAAAKEYAATAQAYIGQKIVVIENNKVTHYSVEDAAGTLKEVGSKPIGDEKSIVVAADGTVSLAGGFAALAYERDILGEDGEPTGQKEEVKYQPVMTKAGLTWIEPSKTTVEGLATLISELTARVSTAEGDIDKLETAVGNAADGDKAATGLFKAIADEIARATTAEENLGKRIDAIDFVDTEELADAIKDFATKDHVATELGKLPVSGVAADDKILALGADKLISATVALSYDSDAKSIKLTGKDGADLGSVDATPFIKDGMLNNVEYNPENNTLTFTWNTDSGELTTDTVVLSDIIEPYTAGDGLQLEGNEFSVKVAEGNEGFLTVDENGVKLSGVQAAIDSAKAAATKDAEDKIADALETAADDATAKAATAEQNAKYYADSKFATTEYVGSFTTGEDEYKDVSTVVAYINKKAEETLKAALGGEGHTETAAEVALALQNYKNENDPKVTKNASDIATINEKLKDVEANAEVNVIEKINVNGVEVIPTDKAVDITVPTKFSDITDDSGFDARITAAQNQADKGVNDASAAQTTANEAKGAAEANATSIGTLNTTVAGHTSTISEHITKIANLETFQSEHTALYNSLKSTVDGHVTAIAGKAEQTALDAVSAKAATNETALKTLNDTTIPSINAEINKKAAQTDLDALAAIVGDKADASKVYTKAQVDAINGNLTEGMTIAEMIAAAQAAATYNDTQVKQDIATNTAAITLLNDSAEKEGSVKHTVATELAKIVNDNNNGSVDTLNEIAAWIISDTSGAAKMNADIAANKVAIDKLNGDVNTAGSVLAMIAENAPSIATKSIAGIVKSVDAIVSEGQITNAAEIENKVHVEADGTMSVNSLNVNKLTQTAGTTLILNGGSADI